MDDKLTNIFSLVESVPDDTDPDEPLWMLAVRVAPAARPKWPQPLCIGPLRLHEIAGNIFEARGVTLNGLEALAQSESIEKIEGATELQRGNHFGDRPYSGRG